MKSWYKNRGISFKISFMFASLFLMMIGVLTFILYNHFQKTVNESVMSAVSGKVSDNMSQMQSLLERIEISVDLVYDNDTLYYEGDVEIPPICKMLLSYKTEPGNENVPALLDEYESNIKLFNDYFSACFGSTGTDYSNIIFVDTGLPVHKFLKKFTDFAQGNGFRSSVKAQETEWYQQARQMNGDIYWFILPEYDTRLCMGKLLKHTYIDGDRQLQVQEIGVLTLSFDIAAIYDRLDIEGLTSGSEIYLIDRNREIVFSSNQQSNFSRLLEDQYTWQEGIQEVQYGGQPCQIYFKELPMDLAMMAVVPLDDIQSLTSDTIRIIIVVGIIAVCIAVAVILFMAARIVAPIKRLSKHMETGHAELISYDTVGQDETGKLYRAFNTLMTRLHQSMEDTVQAMDRQKEAELRALQAQINPHFVYNTLNSVSSLALYYGKADIAEVVGNLSKIMRYSISSPNELVPIRTELDIIKQYENIQKSCYWEEVTFRYEIAPETLDFLIPKLIIQPLIENTLKHGLDHGEGRAEVRLITTGNEDGIQIVVWDSGKNADVDKLNRYVSGEASEDFRSNSIGVRNVWERIRIVFGEQGNLHYEKDEEGHTMAVIRICGRRLSNGQTDEPQAAEPRTGG